MEEAKQTSRVQGGRRERASESGRVWKKKGVELEFKGERKKFVWKSKDEIIKEGEQNLRNLLERTLIKTVLKSKRGSPKTVITLTPNDTVASALKTLARYKILSAPVRARDKQEYEGFIDVMDLLKFILTTITGEADEKVQWSSYARDFKTLRTRDHNIAATPISAVLAKFPGNKFCPVSQDGNLFQLVDEVFSHKIHRAPVFDYSGPRERLVGVISQTDVARFLAEHIDVLGPAAQRTLEEFGIAHVLPSVISVSDQALAVHAFFLMYFNKVSAVAVVDSDGKLVANISASDLRGLAKDGLSGLLLPVKTFLLNAQDIPRHPLTCKLKSRVQHVIGRLGLFRLHRLWIVDGDDRPVGLVSLSDIMTKIPEL